MASKIRERIVESAVSCFAKHGYAGCSTKELAERADVTEGSLFRLFGSKKDLFTEALALIASKSLPQTKFAQLLNSGNLEEGVTGSLTALYKSTSTDSFRLARFAMLENPADAAKIIGPSIEGRVKMLTRRLRRAISKGEARKGLDANAAATVIFFAMRNLRYDSLFVDRTQRAQLVLLEKFIQVWLRGVGKERANSTFPQ